MEQLKQYLAAMTAAEREDFATRCGTSAGHLRNICYGGRTCAPELAICIERESKGAVTCEHLCPDVDWAYVRGTAPERKRA